MHLLFLYGVYFIKELWENKGLDSDFYGWYPSSLCNKSAKNGCFGLNHPNGT